MSDTRSLSPRVPPPMHPTRRQNHVVNSPVQLAVPLRGSSYTPSQTSTSASSTGTSTPTSSKPVVVPGTDATELPALEEDMSEAQLRQLYDEEEVDRFLRLFSSVSIFPSLVIIHSL